MSRFVALVHENHQKLSPAFFLKMAGQLQKRLSCSQTRLELVFPFFLEKKAPVSGQSGILDYRATWRAEWIGAQKRWQQSVQVPIGTLCPCSKAISDRGAHNQRGIVTVSLQGQKPIPETKLVSLIEKCASSPLYSLLKRTDEKFVTEQAYDQPAFVEDVVRNVTLALRRLAVTAFRVETENFESIHNHNAYACVQEGAWLE
jgi:GTP cyclohydrolase I